MVHYFQNSISIFSYTTVTPRVDVDPKLSNFVISREPVVDGSAGKKSHLERDAFVPDLASSIVRSSFLPNNVPGRVDRELPNSGFSRKEIDRAIVRVDILLGKKLLCGFEDVMANNGLLLNTNFQGFKNLPEELMDGEHAKCEESSEQFRINSQTIQAHILSYRNVKKLQSNGHLYCCLFVVDLYLRAYDVLLSNMPSAHMSCFQGLFFCPEAASLLLHNFCIYHISPLGHELGASAICPEDFVPSMDDSADQIVEAAVSYVYGSHDLCLYTHLIREHLLGVNGFIIRLNKEVRGTSEVPESDIAQACRRVSAGKESSGDKLSSTALRNLEAEKLKDNQSCLFCFSYFKLLIFGFMRGTSSARQCEVIAENNNFFKIVHQDLVKL
ncbi:hypothetical protein RND71_008725 [Anisodus tanguticus]|uniref:Uncharacterized protein n=1 Tax=Anisodus tanguticus TaxID=243964 RepID=A0AAE1SRF5_9SOLA|nr:hypothetical protein RND71_008725 [Anisodus tanguticus]